jgi:hypothetical protein
MRLFITLCFSVLRTPVLLLHWYTYICTYIEREREREREPKQLVKAVLVEYQIQDQMKILQNFFPNF